MKKRDRIKEEAGDRILHPHKVIRNVLGKQYRIGQEIKEEEVE